MEVFTIPLGAAMAWLKGKTGEPELRAAAGTAPDVVFIMQLESLDTYEELLRRCRTFAAGGSVAVSARTKNPLIRRHMERFGCQVFCTEHLPNGETHWRLMGGPETFRRWIRFKAS